eukprot:m.17088 g.17088  ORF g.17088 m.17088 type:complete len:200 (+) comp5895_c0_seq2:325-924(+)
MLESANYFKKEMSMSDAPYDMKRRRTDDSMLVTEETNPITGIKRKEEEILVGPQTKEGKETKDIVHEEEKGERGAGKVKTEFVEGLGEESVIVEVDVPILKTCAKEEEESKLCTDRWTGSDMKPEELKKGAVEVFGDKQIKKTVFGDSKTKVGRLKVHVTSKGEYYNIKFQVELSQMVSKHKIKARIFHALKLLRIFAL